MENLEFTLEIVLQYLQHLENMTEIQCTIDVSAIGKYCQVQSGNSRQTGCYTQCTAQQLLEFMKKIAAGMKIFCMRKVRALKDCSLFLDRRTEDECDPLPRSQLSFPDNRLSTQHP